MTARAPTSVVLSGLLGPEAPEQVTLGCLMGKRGERSFGLVLLILARLGVALAAALAMQAAASVAAWEALSAAG